MSISTQFVLSRIRPSVPLSAPLDYLFLESRKEQRVKLQLAVGKLIRTQLVIAFENSFRSVCKMFSWDQVHSESRWTFF